MAQVPDQGNVRLIINGDFYLETPYSSLCCRPRKYLRYLGWCVLGVKGLVAMNYPHPEGDIGDEGSLEDKTIYSYNPHEVPGGLSFFIGTWIITL
jgi:hypothetical protein